MSATAALRLRRLPFCGYSRYATLDGRFEVEQAANETGPWQIRAASPDTAQQQADFQRLVLSESDRPFRTLRRAREWLGGSVYAEPHGWLHVPAEQVAADYAVLASRPFSE